MSSAFATAMALVPIRICEKDRECERDRERCGEFVKLEVCDLERERARCEDSEGEREADRPREYI
ncbi:hypothetical protein CCR75_004746 [Bremia lactucae]|uniref:Uncharacterized protein n=1 Tax=Bremia lactucae TaxID=4779 RepID=A0A976FKT2_BRELC|nr:hypothetical protein CCR75_004746 [Bremia lactucae]